MCGSYNDYKLAVSNTLMSRDVSSITVTDSRGGLRVRHTQARETTVMKNKCRRDLPSHNDEIFNPSGWEREEGGFSSPRQRQIQRHHELGRENGNGEVKKKRAIEKSPAVKLAADRF